MTSIPASIEQAAGEAGSDALGALLRVSLNDDGSLQQAATQKALGGSIAALVDLEGGAADISEDTQTVALGTIASGSGEQRSVLFTAPYPCVVTGLRLVSTTDVASNSSAYWIAMLRRRKMSLPVTPYSAEVLADSPFGYWKLDEALAAANALDSGSGAHNLAYSATPPTLAQTSLVRRASDASALFVAASSTNAKAAAGYTWDFSGNTFTIEALINSNVLGTPVARRTIFSRPTTAGMPSIELGGASASSNFSGKISALQPGVFQYETAGYTILPGNTYHVVYRKNGSGAGTQDWFINGVKQRYGVNVVNANDYATGSAVTIIGSREAGGGAPAGQFFDGFIDDVAVYMTALSDARIQAHASAGATLAEIARKTTDTLANGGEAVTAWQPWTFDMSPFDTYAQVLDKDDVVSLALYPSGAAASLTGLTATLSFRPL